MTERTQTSFNSYPLPQIGFLRIGQIIGDKKAIPPIPPIIPVSKSTWWAGCASGLYPKPIKWGMRCTVWKAEDIQSLCDRLAKGA